MGAIAETFRQFASEYLAKFQNEMRGKSPQSRQRHHSLSH